ncbi:hypothetical protein H0H93_000728 [Arthromyces matolae]|nr:hypothetical protein H0H93_000728 [Arthromyces matolae]
MKTIGGNYFLFNESGKGYDIVNPDGNLVYVCHAHFREVVRWDRYARQHKIKDTDFVPLGYERVARCVNSDPFCPWGLVEYRSGSWEAPPMTAENIKEFGEDPTGKNVKRSPNHTEVATCCLEEWEINRGQELIAKFVDPAVEEFNWGYVTAHKEAFARNLALREEKMTLMEQNRVLSERVSELEKSLQNVEAGGVGHQVNKPYYRGRGFRGRGNGRRGGFGGNGNAGGHAPPWA